MAYLASSHHKGAGKAKRRQDYPSDDEIEAVLPLYRDWLSELGKEQLSILVMIDVMDAMRSKRPYKAAKDPQITKDVTAKEILLEEIEEDKKKQYKEILDFISIFWEQMREAEAYTHRRNKQKDTLTESFMSNQALQMSPYEPLHPMDHLEFPDLVLASLEDYDRLIRSKDDREAAARGLF